MRIFFLIMAMLFTSGILPSLHAQSRWTDADYQRLNHTNYQQEAMFNERIDISMPDYRRLHALLFFMVNEQREKKGLPILKYHVALEIAAFRHSEAMVRGKFFSHENPKDAARKTTANRAKLAGIANPHIAENIASFSNSTVQTYRSVAIKLMGQWMASSGHKSNILSKNALQFACGTFQQKGSWCGTQVFQWYEEIKAVTATDSLPK